LADKRFHLAWFKSFTRPDWTPPFEHPEPGFLDGESHVRFAQALERACFDFLMIEDSSMVPDTYGGSMAAALERGVYAPKGDPVQLHSLLTGVTERLGVIATMSSSFYTPWQLARSVATLDHLSGGRSGWNCVTSTEDRAAQNMGVEELPAHDERYDRADEFVEVVRKYWGAWDADATVQAGGVAIDPDRVHRVEHSGTYYRSAGTLNLPRSPQGDPVICQAGGSPRGRRFAATHADVIVAAPSGLDEMREYRDQVRRYAAEAGRDPDSVKVMFVVVPTIGETDEAAAAKRAAAVAANGDERSLVQLILWSATMEIDFAQFAMDAPIPEDAETNGNQSALVQLKRRAAGRTLRETMKGYQTETLSLVGSPATVAERMADAMGHVGGDGFLIMAPGSRRYLSDITDGLVPELQRRGLMRSGYRTTTLRDHLREF
jgi:long-chain alkane monooxygenase